MFKSRLQIHGETIKELPDNCNNHEHFQVWEKIMADLSIGNISNSQAEFLIEKLDKKRKG